MTFTLIAGNILRMRSNSNVGVADARVVAMSAPRRFTGTPFLVPNVSTEEVGWKAKLSKWQWALVIGLPLAAAAAVAGLVLLIGSRRRRVTGRDGSPPPSMTPTPVASPTSTTVKTAEKTDHKEGVCSN